MSLLARTRTRVADTRGRIDEEVPPARAARGDVAAQLGIVAEREAHDARTVTIVQDPRVAVGNGDFGIEAQGEFAERLAVGPTRAQRRPRRRPG